MNTVVAPKSPPTNTYGIVISTAFNLIGEIILTSSMKAVKSKKQARAADPTEYPLALALVTFPTASNLSVIFLTDYGQSLISTIPPALSAIGPNPLIERTKTPVQNIPIVATAVPNKPPIFYPYKFVISAMLPK